MREEVDARSHDKKLGNKQEMKKEVQPQVREERSLKEENGLGKEGKMGARTL